MKPLPPLLKRINEVAYRPPVDDELIVITGTTSDYLEASRYLDQLTKSLRERVEQALGRDWQSYADLIALTGSDQHTLRQTVYRLNLEKTVYRRRCGGRCIELTTRQELYRER